MPRVVMRELSIKHYFKVESSRDQPIRVRKQTNQRNKEIILVSSEEDEEDYHSPQKETDLRRSARLRESESGVNEVIDDSEKASSTGISDNMIPSANRVEKRVIDENKEILQDSQEIVPLKRGKLGRAPIWDSDDENEDSDTRTNGEASEIMENTAEKRSVDENEEIFPDSQEVVPFKRRKSSRTNRICDSDDEEHGNNESGTGDDLTVIETQETYGSQVESLDSDSECDESGSGKNLTESESQETDESQLTCLNSDVEDTDDSFDSENDDQIDTDEEEWINSFREIDPRYLYEDVGGRRKSRKKRVTYEDNQEVSIHKIKLDHHKFSSKSVEDIIRIIVRNYNDDRENNRAEKKNKFKKIKVQRDFEPAVKPEDEEHFKGDGFRVKVYVQKVERTISLLSSYGIKEKTTTIHSLIFHYRKKELFAITTNQAWNVVQWCSDFEFPHKIAARILSKDGKVESTEKGLAGTELTRKTTHKQQKKTNPYDLLTLCTRFTAKLRNNASILKLSCFQKKNSIAVESGEESEVEEEARARILHSESNNVKIAVSLGSIRIIKRLSTSDILSILSILSEISNGKDTFTLDGEKELDSSAHKKYLTSVHTEVSNELNLCISDLIHDAIVDDNRMAELDNYQFCHKHSTDFFSGYRFTLYYKNDIVKVFGETPTIREIAYELRHNLGEIENGTSREAFLKLLNNAKISYHFGTNGAAKKKEKFLNFIDGLFTHPRDSSVFWHVSAMWYHVHDGYLYLVHSQFKNILTSSLLTDKNHPAFLHVHWPNSQSSRTINSEAKLTNYLKKYSTFENTWNSELPGQDIVDMIKIGKSSAGKIVFFVYYFMPGPNFKTNIKCNHVAESIMQIGKANSHMLRQTQGGSADVAGSEDVRKQLKDVYQKVMQKRQFKTICPNFDKFLKMITEAKFFLAIGRDVPIDIDVPSLADEKEMTEEITVADIADILENLIDADDLRMLNETAETLNQPFEKSRCSQLAESIHHQLRQHEYIEAQGNSIRGKLLNQSKNHFELTSNGSVNKFLFGKIISKFQPRACTVLSKLAFINMGKEISKLTIKSFNIIEIPKPE